MTDLMTFVEEEDTTFDPKTFWKDTSDPWLRIMRHPSIVHVNDYVSVSRIKTFDQCNLKFWYEYVADYPRGENEAADFGKFCHEVLESVYKWVVAEEFQGIVPEEKIIEIFRAEWEANLGLLGPKLYTEALAIVRGHFNRFPDIDCWDILGIEVPFEIEIQGRKIRGAIDRVDRIDHETIEIIDYKSNRQMFEREELEVDIQVSMYAIVVPMLWPWAKKVRFRFDMLRHEKDQFTQRTSEELAIAADYIVSTANRTERETPEWPAKLGFLCNYCAHRKRCPAYEKAITQGEFHSDLVDVSTENLIAVSRERERLNNLKSVIEGRVKELDKTIKSVAAENGETTIGEYTYRLITVNKKTYSLPDLLPILKKHSSLSSEEIMGKITKVDKAAADALIAEVKSQWEGSGSRPKKAMFAMEIATTTSEEFWFAKFDSRLNKSALRAPAAGSSAALPEHSETKALPAPAEALTCDFCQAKGANLVERGGVRFAVCEEHKNKRKAPKKE